ncbi:AAA family ATPase [Gimesia algae]|uniref:Recombination protein F n=1 Tax=Gimesia algae TaxID=2527971 RepID=A0A517V711_9PLAN|nr:AAA family ATPase [Gimesia algae]QDT88796.1 recombination protein F [Gimesia algae]
MVRCIRSTQGRDFAVYYIDISETIPGSVDELNAYQDRIVASRYFDGSKSLQWSQYLYFVISEEVAPELRTLVERDRKYARKFVVNEQELTSALTPPRFQVAEGVIDTSVMSTWTEILAESNLDRAIFNNESLPNRIKLIEADFGHKGLSKPSAVKIPRAEAPPFIKNLTLKEYRSWPRQRFFDLGSVTLLTGPNGTGKTSLLEAIELLYCGVNNRDPKSKTRYSINASFQDGTEELAKLGQPTASRLRERNLAWYSQTDIRTNTLYQSFSRYNFLDTDAAVGLADSKKDFEEDLSKLLVGPEASKTWREIERTVGQLDKELKELTSVEQQIELELHAVERQLSAATSVPKESDALLKSLATTLAEAGWKEPSETLPENVSELISSFGTRSPIVEEALRCEWTGTPVTIEKLRKYVSESGNLIVEIEAMFTGIQQLLRKVKENQRAVQHLDRRVTSIRELSPYVQLEFVQKHESLLAIEQKLREVQQTLSGQTKGPSSLDIIPEFALPLFQFHDENLEKFKKSDAEIIQFREQLANFIKLRDQAQALSQQLRDIAKQILAQAEVKDACPLCHAEYPDGKLNDRIYQDVNAQLETQSLKLRDNVREAEDNYAKSKDTVAVSEWLLGFVDRIGMNRNDELILIKKALNELIEQEENLQLQLKITQTDFQFLQQKGLTIERYDSLTSSLFVDETLERPTPALLNSLLTELVESQKELSASLTTTQKQISAKLDELSKLLGEESLSLDECQSSITKQKGQIAQTQAILKRLDEKNTHFIFQEDQPLPELLTTIQLIRKVLSDVQIAMTNEQQAVVVVFESAKRKEEILDQLSGWKPRIKRLRDAQAVFQEILEKNSLESAMEAALQKNKEAIDEIFRRIHSPAEFSHLKNMTTLVRKTGEEAKLQQISTGQRAALALSLFLAQNAQLRSAPPLMLIDDPIAHVDDLNCLSFLDYLREVALTGERQIVFATANDKLASLFERKFDFLGREFMRHDLQR